MTTMMLDPVESALKRREQWATNEAREEGNARDEAIARLTDVLLSGASDDAAVREIAEITAAWDVSDSEVRSLRDAIGRARQCIDDLAALNDARSKLEAAVAKRKAIENSYRADRKTADHTVRACRDRVSECAQAEHSLAALRQSHPQIFDSSPKPALRVPEPATKAKQAK